MSPEKAKDKMRELESIWISFAPCLKSDLERLDFRIRAAWSEATTCLVLKSMIEPYFMEQFWKLWREVAGMDEERAPKETVSDMPQKVRLLLLSQTRMQGGRSMKKKEEKKVVVGGLHGDCQYYHISDYPPEEQERMLNLVDRDRLKKKPLSPMNSGTHWRKTK